MIICKKCGTDNALGRVFCTSCGTKLDLTAMSSESIATKEKGSWLAENWPKLVLTVLLVLLASLVGLAFWPAKSVAPEKNSAGNARRVESQIESLSRIKQGQRVGPYVVTTQDLNGYLVELAKKAKVTSMRANLGKDSLDAGMTRVLATVGAATNKVPLTITFEAGFVPEGGRLKIVRGAVGHLKLFGPMLRIAEVAFSRALAADPKTANLSMIEEIKIEEGKMSIIVSKK